MGVFCVNDYASRSTERAEATMRQKRIANGNSDSDCATVKETQKVVFITCRDGIYQVHEFSDLEAAGAYLMKMDWIDGSLI